MIKCIDLQEFPESLSRTQITRLTVGDEVILSNFNHYFSVTVAFRREDDLAGVVQPGTSLPAGVNEKDLIAFEVKHIYHKTPKESHAFISPFMLLTHHAHPEKHFVFHTRYPRMIALIQPGEQVIAQVAEWLDEPTNRKYYTTKLLHDITNWYFYNYIKR